MSVIHPSQIDAACRTANVTGLLAPMLAAVELINAIHADPALLAMLGKPAHAKVRAALDAAHVAMEGAGVR